MTTNAILIGNSDGIGLATTRALLKRGWSVVGISRSPSPIAEERYRHHVLRVQDRDYALGLTSVLGGMPSIDLCIFFAGVGELLDVQEMQRDVEVFAVNLLGMVTTVAAVAPRMVNQGHGHIIGLSSLADQLLSPETPSYAASKAGFSSYLESLGLALRPKGVHVTNVRFGFVDTKMAKADAKPLMMPVSRAVSHLFKCIDRKPIRYTAPRLMALMLRLYAWVLRLKVAFVSVRNA